jgi:hypothetical protein
MRLSPWCRFLTARVLVAALAAGCGTAAPAVRSAPAAARPAVLPAWMLPIVRSQMTRHRDLLNELRWSA